MSEQFKYTVCIHCMTYNHEKYLADALEGFVMQKTNFPFVAVVIDDFSTDGTADILRQYEAKYPDIIKAVYLQENYYSQHKSKKPFLEPYDSQSKYIAMCEGDDYWIDPYKLQKQVEFLESHPDYGFVGTYNDLLYKDGRREFDNYEYGVHPIEIQNGWELYGNIFNDAAKYGPVTRTVTLCYRKTILEPYLSKRITWGDFVLQSVLAHESKFAKLQDATAVYRVGVGVSAPTSYEKEVSYAQWYVNCRLTQNKLFPSECHWNEDELQDRITYVKLRYACYNHSYREAKLQKGLLKSKLYKKKTFARFLVGPFSCWLLSIYASIKKRYS